MNYPEIEKLLPHKSPMLLIDKVLWATDTEICCELEVRTDNIFYKEDIAGIPSHIGIELMAQTIAALAGLKAFNKQQKAPIGLLLGCRRYKDSGTHFLLNRHIMITATLTMSDDAMGVYQAKIFCEDQEFASAQVNAYVPDEKTLKKMTTNDPLLNND